MAWTLQFVDSIASSPTVRLDLNDGSPFGLLIEGTSFGTPSLRLAQASTLMRNGSAFPAGAYGERTITIRLKLPESTRDAVATAMQELHRELDRPNNFLKWQPDSATNPVFFRTLRTSPDRWDDYPYTPTPYNEVTVNLLAEPFAYGLKETASAVTITNNPASGTNPMYWDVTSVKGDVETPIILHFTSTVAAKVMAVAVDSSGATAWPFFLQAESMTLGTNASLPGNDAVMSGSGSNYVRVTPGTTTMTNRVTHSLWPPAPGQTGYRGKYRVLMRYRNNTGTDVWKSRILWGSTSTDVVVGSTVTLASSTERRYADLGLVSLPLGADPVDDGYSGSEWPASGVPMAIQAERTSGAGTHDIDVLGFLPAEQICYVHWPSAISGTDWAVLDGVKKMAYRQLDNGSGTPRSISYPSVPVEGVFPTIKPSVTNRIYVMANVSTVGPEDSVTFTTAVTLSYFPRYLYLRPAAS